MRNHRIRGVVALAAALVASTLSSSGAVATAAAPDAVVQPAAPTSGPGSNGRHQRWKVTEGGRGADAWYVFEPRAPKPRTAPVAVITHGYFEYAGYDQMYELIRHTVLRGSIVIYPRYQTAAATPCPGPINIEPCLDSAVAGIEGALRYLRRSTSAVQPRLDETSYFGFSFGGIITANLANRWRDLGLPKPQVMFLDDPHDGGLAGAGEPALDDSLAGIPRSTLVQCHSGADGVIAEPDKAGSSCNAVFPRLSRIPAARKDLVLTHTDAHGSPALSSTHGVCAGGKGQADAYDWNFCWKVWDALRTSARTGRLSRLALGDTPAHRDLGRWSDGTPITPLVVQDAGPLVP